MAIITALALDNFRVIQDETPFAFAPFTILTGANNAGKSTILKALLLLADNAKRNQLQELDFTGEAHQLGSYTLAKNRATDVEKMRFGIHFEQKSPLFTHTQLQFSMDYIPYHHEKDGWLVKFALKDAMDTTYIRYEEVNLEKEGTKGHTYIDFPAIVQQLLQTPDKTAFPLSEEEWADLGQNHILNKTTFDPLVHGQKNKETFEALFHEKVSEFLFNAYQQPGFWQYLGNSKSWNHYYLQFPLDDQEIINSFFSPEEQIEFADCIAQLQSVRLFKLLHPVWCNVMDKILVELGNIVQELMDCLTKIHFLEPVKAHSRRLYSYDQSGMAINQLLVNFAKADFQPDSPELQFIGRWISKEGFGIGDNIEFIDIPEIGGTSINIFKKGHKYNLAEMGYGTTQIVPLLLKIVMSARNSTLYLEEPEINLHPNYQSQLADLFIDAIRSFGLRLIVETHSEYLIRRLQVLTAESSISPDESVIYYFYEIDDIPSGKKQIEAIHILEDGKLDHAPGSGLLDMSDKLAIDLFRLVQKKAKK